MFDFIHLTNPSLILFHILVLGFISENAISFYMYIYGDELYPIAIVFEMLLCVDVLYLKSINYSNYEPFCNIQPPLSIVTARLDSLIILQLNGYANQA